MSNQNIKCKHCGEEISSKAAVCPKCGVKNKKPLYKRAWFIVAVVIIVIGVISSMSGGDSGTSTEVPEQEIVYTEYSAKQLIDDLESNALNAKNKYDNQYVKLTGKLNNIDSNGDYISVSDGSITFYSVMCYLKSDEQRAAVASMSEGDNIVVKGKIKDVGEVMGYSLDVISFE